MSHDRAVASAAASRAFPGRLLEGEDAAGQRYYLDGRPLWCGDVLELRLPGDRWTYVTFQMERRRAVIVLYVGNRYEQRFQVRLVRELPACAGLPEEDFVILDTREGAVVRLTDRWPEELTGANEPLWPELEHDHWSDRREAELSARVLNDIYAGCEPVTLREVDRCELRWPGTASDEFPATSTIFHPA
jgi:hypothetical protein